MRAVALKAKGAVHNSTNRNALGRFGETPGHTPTVQPFAGVPSQRKASCACGGGCPRCQAKSNLKISQPNDPAEIEAGQIADKVMRMPVDPMQPVKPTGHVSCIIRRRCDVCEEENKETIQRRVSHPGEGISVQGVEHVQRAISSGGRPLDSQTRGFFEPRLGCDLSAVRLHTDYAAAESAQRLDAQAYTLGHDVVFGSGEYRPESESGRRLLAHELAHVAQNDTDRLRRRVKVNAAASDDPATAISMIDPLVTQLCPDFETNTTTGVITPKSGTPCSIPRFRAVAASSNPLGCCCLCTMTRPWGADWDIIVTSSNSPTTDESGHRVRMTPTTGPNAPDLRHWTGGPIEVPSSLPAVEAFGHELCGHAALMKIRAHPAHVGDRAYSDVHDPTVRIENELANEMGLGGRRRGLAAGGTHRGESLRVFLVGPFSPDTDDPAPFAAQIATAVAFLDGNPRLMVDTVGFRSAADTNANVSLTRASRVMAEVSAGIAVPTVDVETTPAGVETLPRVQPAADGGVGASAIVELRMAVRPAGLLTPIGASPPAVPVHVDPTNPARVAALKSGSVNECHQLLANTAWP